MTPPLPKPEKPPSVLILGGLTTLARPLALYLLVREEKLASFLRIGTVYPLSQPRRDRVDERTNSAADRFSVNPPTTYLDRPFLDLLSSSHIEYRQCNLASVERHRDIFTLSSPVSSSSSGDGRNKEAEGFDVVFDLTGEIASDRPELTQISNTYALSLDLSQSAAVLPPTLRPKAYIRLTFPFYEMRSLPSSSPGHSESASLRPDGIRGRWWHETLRHLGTVEGLNCGVVRCGAWYGRGTWGGEIVPRVVVGHVYRHLKEEMKFLYNSDLRINTIHTTDLAQALYLFSLYLLATPRQTVLKELGVEIPYSFDPPEKSVLGLGKDKRNSFSDAHKTVKSVIPPTQKVILPLLNVVDDGDSTQDSLGRAVADLWGLKYGFLNSTVTSLVEKFAKDMVDDVNEKHVEAWSAMLTSSYPPIESSPITPYLDTDSFRKHAICLDGSKAKRMLGLRPRHPTVTVEELKEIVKGFQEDGIWPKTS